MSLPTHSDLPNTPEFQIEVSIASPWKRIGAVLINNVLFVLSLIPLVFDFAFQENLLQNFSLELFSIGTALSGLLLLCLTIYQIVLLSKHGQSIGKRLFNIKIIKKDGNEAGFIGAVLLREVVFDILINMISSGLVILLFLSNSSPLGEHGSDMNFSWPSYLVYLVCFIMLFVAKDRRTLQDLIAGTVVVQLPPRSKLF